MVARTTLIGLRDPTHLDSTSLTPTTSNTARMAPPAMIPVPSEAGCMKTRAAPCSAVIGYCRVVPFSSYAVHVLARLVHRLLDGHRHFAGLAITETNPAIAITNHGQRGEAKLPATLTTLATRLTAISFSCRPSVLWELSTFVAMLSTFLKTANRSRGRHRRAPDPAVILEAGAIERDLGDADGLGFLGDRLAHSLGGLDIAGALERLAQGRVSRVETAASVWSPAGAGMMSCA